jgi:hypothetical protein
LAGAVVALLIVWLGRIVSVPLTALLAVGAVIIALSWLVVLTAVPGRQARPPAVRQRVASSGQGPGEDRA